MTRRSFSKRTAWSRGYIVSSSARPDWQTIDVPLRQGALSAAIDESVLKRLLASAPTTRSRALALSTGLVLSRLAKCNLAPLPCLDITSKIVLGVPLHSDQFTCPECLLTLLSLLLWAPLKKVQDWFQTPLLARLLPNWTNGHPAALDVHVISPLQSLTLSEAAWIQGHALQVGVQRKLASNLPNCRSMGLTCIPLVAETLGGLADDFVSTIRDIGRSIGLRSGADGDKITTKHLFGRVSIALWRGNASMLIHRSHLHWMDTLSCFIS